MQLPTSKERLRASVLEARREMPFEEVYRLSLKVQERFISSPWFRRARRISLYASASNEVLTDEIFASARASGKELYYPKVAAGKKVLAFHRIEDLGELEPGSYEVPEPAGQRGDISSREIDLFVVPGVAFDSRGARLGYGGGYFDRTLEGLDAAKVALAYEFQIRQEGIPVEEHDVPMDAIVTEDRIIAVKDR